MFNRTLPYFSMLAVACVMIPSHAATIDEQTPTPNPTLAQSHALVRDYCLTPPEAAEQFCHRVRLRFPLGVSDASNEIVNAMLFQRLGGNPAVDLSKATDDYLHRQAQLAMQQRDAVLALDVTWRNLGQLGALQEMAERVSEQMRLSEDRLNRTFVVLDGEQSVPLLLADILIQGQGDRLTVLQENALLKWLDLVAGINGEEAQVVIRALGGAHSENWALTRGGLVFSYPPLQLNDGVELPLIVLTAQALEGIIRPDILSASRSWPGDVAVQLAHDVSRIPDA